MDYYYLNGVEKVGPLTLKELALSDISLDTLIWYDGMQEWKKLSDLSDLQAKLSNNEANHSISETTNNRGNFQNQKNRITISSFFLLIPLYLVAIFGAYLIVSFEKKQAYEDILQQINSVFRDKDILVDYEMIPGEYRSEGIIYNTYVRRQSDSLDGRLVNKMVIRTQKRILATKPDDGLDYLEQKRWSLLKPIVQYFECDLVSGFSVLCLKRKSNTSFDIIESESVDMAYKIPENTHYYGSLFSTNRPSIDQCYKAAAKYLMNEKDDKTYEANSYEKIRSLPEVRNKFFEMRTSNGGLYKFYKKRKFFYKEKKGFIKGNSIIDRYVVDGVNQESTQTYGKISDVTSCWDPYVYNNQWIVWYKQIVNNYYLEENEDAINTRRFYFSCIGIFIFTIIFMGVKYRHYVIFK